MTFVVVVGLLAIAMIIMSIASILIGFTLGPSEAVWSNVYECGQSVQGYTYLGIYNTCIYLTAACGAAIILYFALVYINGCRLTNITRSALRHDKIGDAIVNAS